MAASFKAAVRDGIDPIGFWSMTPYLTRQAMYGLRDGRVILAWHIAALSRQQKLQPLDQLLGEKKSRAGSSADDLLAAVMGASRGAKGG